MQKSVLPLLFIILILLSLKSQAQDSISTDIPEQINRKVLYKAISLETAYYAGAMLILQNTWYQDRDVVPFHFYNDNSGYLQVDKFGHAFGAYVESYIGYQWLLKTGMSKSKALIYGGSLGLILQTPIEIMDGIHEGWGFSWGDMAANTLGASLVVGQEFLFHEQLLRYKFSYSESVYSVHANGYLGKNAADRILSDYNGHTYWLTVPVNCLIHKALLPSWVSLAAGYGANGMYGEYTNITSYKGVEIPPATRYRQFFLSLDVDWTKINPHSKIASILLKGLTFIKLPFPALEYNSTGKVRAHWLYF